MKLKTLLFSLSLLTAFGVSAHDFTVTRKGQRLCFKITSKINKTAAVTYSGSINDRRDPQLSGVIEIPTKVQYDNVVYTINEIGPKAFAGETLEGIVISSGIENIGDFAFEGCDSLKSVIFPGNPVTFGQGVFFKCPNISDVTIGSDWKSIDFTMFRWSTQLTSINIPARIEKIRGLKKLKYLENITVDRNNANFSSDKGILYTKNGKTLYACPRAYKATVKIPEGTEVIADGALIDCPDITHIDFPTTIKSVSFLETSRMTGLETIVMRPADPIMTGYINNVGKFFFMLCNSKTEIVVLNDSKKKYEESLASEAGQYADNPGGVPYTVTKEKLPTKKNLKGVKNFDKY